MSRLIDADALKEQMLAETPEHEKGVVDVFLEAVAAMIDEQPTIEPERKKGKWNRMGLNDIFHCLECGVTFIVIQGQERMNFCPNCGAQMDMRGEE